MRQAQSCAIAPGRIRHCLDRERERYLRAVFQDNGVKGKAEFGFILSFGAPLRLGHFAHYFRALRQHYFVIRLHLLRDFRHHFIARFGLFGIDCFDQFGLHCGSRRHRRGCLRVRGTLGQANG